MKDLILPMVGTGILVYGMTVIGDSIRWYADTGSLTFGSVLFIIGALLVAVAVKDKI